MSLSMPTDAIASDPSTHVNVDAKSEFNYARNDQTEAHRYRNNDEDDSDYPEGGATAWLVVLGAWCAMMYVLKLSRNPQTC